MLFLLISCGFNPSFVVTTSSSTITNTTTTSLNVEKESTSSVTSINSTANRLTFVNTTLLPVLKEVDIDVNKEQFKFDQNLKYDAFYNELKKNNFTLTIELGSRQIYEDEEVVYTPYAHEILAINEGLYIYDTLEVAKILNNKVHIALINLNNPKNICVLGLNL